LRAHTDIQQLLKQDRMIVTATAPWRPGFKASASDWKCSEARAKNASKHQSRLYQPILSAVMKPKIPHFQPSAPNTETRPAVVAISRQFLHGW